MSIQLPNNDGQLITLGTQFVHGLLLDGAALEITQISANQMQTVLTDFINADNTYNAARSARDMASKAFQAGNLALGDWLPVVKGALVSQFGITWSTQWAQAGFINYSTAIPQKFADRYALAQRLVGFYTANPQDEVPRVLVTAQHGRDLCANVIAAQAALTAAAKALQAQADAWTVADSALTDLMWSLIKILQATLNDDDVRWLDFGLPLPGTPSTPGQPQNVTALLGDDGSIVVSCDATPLATRYRWRTKLVGAQDAYVLAASSKEPMAALTNVLTGQTVSILVQAVNGSLQGVASAAIEFTVPLAKAAPVTAEVPVASHGHANGHHSRI